MNVKRTQTQTIEANESVLLLIDYQAKMLYGVESSDRTLIQNNVLALAKGAQVLNIPTILTSIGEKLNGQFMPEIVEMFPDTRVIARKVPGFDAFDDEDVLNAVNRTGKKQLVLTGLWTSMCFAFTALHGLREGFDVFGVMDAAGSESPDAHNTAVQRMIQAGIVPCTWMQTVSEWMNNWGNPKADQLLQDVYNKYSAFFAQKL
ncbi:MAG: isochorismatase family protein [Halobacteriota archaeon]|jgi:nicotinamidase-related amidase